MEITCFNSYYIIYKLGCSIAMLVTGGIFIGIQGDCFKTDPLRGQNQLLFTLIHSYPILSTLIHSYLLLSTLIPLLSTLIPLLSNSYPTLIHSYPTLIQLLFTLNFKSNVLHSYSLLSTLNKYGRFRINGVYLDLTWCINGKDYGSKWISARKIGVLGLTSS